MKLTTLVPTMGLIAAAGSAQAFDLASTAEGKLHITGYVDAILQFSMYQQNAPRPGEPVYDNPSVWSTAGRTATYGSTTFSTLTIGGTSASTIGYNIYVGDQNDLYNPTSSYFSNAGAPNAAGAYLISGATTTSGGLSITVGPTVSSSGNPVAGLSTSAGLGSTGKVPLAYRQLTGMELISGSSGGTSYSGVDLSTGYAMVDSQNQSVLDFAATAEIGLSYDITEDVLGCIELELGDDASVEVEQAYINWTLSENMCSLQAGRYDNWLGWEDTDPTGLYRVNNSIVANALTGTQVTGVRAGINPVYTDDFKLNLAINVVDEVFGDPYGIKDGNDLAFGLEASADVKDGLFKAGLRLTVDKNATYDADVIDQAWQQAVYLPAIVPGFPASFGVNAYTWAAGDFREDVLGGNFFMEIDPDGANQGLLFALDVHQIDYDLANGRGLMFMTNYMLPQDMVAFPMGVTFMASYLDPNDEDVEILSAPAISTLLTADDTITMNEYVFYNGEGDEETELALALLTNPTGSDNFAVNFEARYIMRQDIDLIPEGSSQMGEITLENRNEIGFFLEMLAVLP